MTLIFNGWTLKEARKYTEDGASNGGVICPCCDQRSQVYERQLNSQMARALIKLYRTGGTTEYVHFPTLVGEERADECKLRYWGLIEELAERRLDGGRSGWWRVTAGGDLFVRGEMAVPSTARVYDGKCLGLTGELISIGDALNKKFNYAELMFG